jgi:hypothetical protein
MPRTYLDFSNHTIVMTSAFSSHSDALKLVLEDRPYVSGERLAGFIDLDLARAKEEDIDSIKIKLRGSVST